MIVRMVRIDVQRERELPVALETRAFIIAFELLMLISFTRPRGKATGFCLHVLAVASDDQLTPARFFFLTGGGVVAALLAGVAARLLRIAARLLAFGHCILTLTGTVARFAAKVRATPQPLAANLAADDLSAKTGLILERLALTEANLLHQIRAAGAGLLIAVTVVLNTWVTTGLGTLTREAAWRWSCSAG